MEPHAWQSLLDTLNRQIAILDHTGTIVAVNAAWTRSARDVSLAGPPVGAQFLAICEAAAGAGDAGATEAAAYIQAVLASTREDFQLRYSVAGHGRRRWYALRGRHITRSEPVYVLLEHASTATPRPSATIREPQFDPVTALPDRELFGHRVKMAIKAAQLTPTPLAILVIEIDGGVEAVADPGIRFDDAVLRTAASCLHAGVRQADSVARVGTAAFGVLLPGAADIGAVLVAHRLHDALEVGLESTMGRAELRTQIGVALFPDHGSSGAALLTLAAQATAAAKLAGQAVAIYVRPDQAVVSGASPLCDDPPSEISPDLHGARLRC